jgi:urea transport system ATP-binding protein
MALDIDYFAVRERDVRVVIGPNGAGKTTLCDVISGKTRLMSGRCFFDGVDITRAKDFEIARRGVGRKFQTPTVFGSLTVRENLELALPATGGPLRVVQRRPPPASVKRSSGLPKVSVCSASLVSKRSISVTGSGNCWRSGRCSWPAPNCC